MAAIAFSGFIPDEATVEAKKKELLGFIEEAGLRVKQGSTMQVSMRKSCTPTALAIRHLATCRIRLAGYAVPPALDPRAISPE